MRAASHGSPEAFLTRTLKPFELVSDEGLELLEHNADTILEEVGVEIRDYPSALDRFRDAGADVDGSRVRFPRGLCRQIVQATAPGDVHPARPQSRAQRAGRRRRHGVRPQLRLAVRPRPRQRPALRHDRRLRELREAGLPVARTCTTRAARCASRSTCRCSKRHLDMVYAHLRYSDKPFMGSVTAGERAADRVELARIGVRRRPRRPHRDDEPDQRLLAARVGRARCSPPPRSTPQPTRRRSSPRSSSPGRWRRRRRRASPPRRSPRRWPGWRSPSSCGRARR